jgi:2-dehydro-3-deoxy-D-arabinonate dehydratase
MRLLKFTLDSDPTPRVGCLEEGLVIPLGAGPTALSDLLNGPDVASAVEDRKGRTTERHKLASVRLLAPIDRQEVWGAGVTDERSTVARQEESEQGATFYDLVYRAPRPELFFKATPSRVAGPSRPVRIRRDTKWSVPEPELALVLSPSLELIGFTVGNDMSARDIEGENPLYLPQAKVYDGCCALGPVITLAAALPKPEELEIRLEIERGGAFVFDGRTSTARMARRYDELIGWLGRDNLFPDGAVLLTGTGVVPPDDFSLAAGDVARITIEGIGVLENPVVQGD